MKYLYANKITDEIKGTNDINEITANLIDRFYDELVTPENQELLSLAFSSSISQENLDVFLKNNDIEKLGGHKALLLSHIMKNNSKLKFSSYEAPRLTGLLNYFRFHNLQTISHYTKVGKALNQKNIIPMILKGGVIKYLRPELSRVMEDIDILVYNDQEFNQACEISKTLGYEFIEGADEHSVDLHVPGSTAGTVDIHRYIELGSNYDKQFIKTLFARANKQKVFGVESYIPCNEDIVFIALINMARNLHKNSSTKGILYTPLDCQYFISQSGFDWNIVIDNALQTNTIVQLFFTIKFINKIIPGLLPEKLLQNKRTEREIRKYCDCVMFYRFYVHDIKMLCKKLKLRKALCSFSVMKDYIKTKPKHFFLKRINKNYTLIKIFLKLTNKKQRKQHKCA